MSHDQPSRLKRNVSLAGAVVFLVMGFEGVRYVAYRDPIGIPTICAGVTKGVRLGMKKTPAECDMLLMEELLVHEAGMLRCMPNADSYPEGAYTAFLDLTYNIGTGALCKSTLARKANAGDLTGACNELTKWDKANGRRLPGLTRRRKTERDLCLKDI